MTRAATSCDYLVVGAGAAGCVVASRLSEDRDARVVLLEAGGPLDNIAFKIPALAYMAAKLPERNWNFETEPVAALGGRRQTWYQGKVVGGSGSINGMNFMRGTAAEFDRWGCEGWSFGDLLPYFKKTETNSRGAGRWHGDSGPVRTRPSNLRLPICEAFLEAAREAGFAIAGDLNAGIDDAFGYYDVNIDRGRRSSSARAYLGPARRRKNLRLLTRTPALRILTEGGHATGVEAGYGSNRETIRAEREVILCAGAVSTPHLLLVSGIGPADHLRSHGVAVSLDAPEVGRNLANHPAYRLRYECSAPVTAYSYLTPSRAAAAAARYALTRGGPLAEAFAATGGVFRSDPALEAADVFVIMTPVLVEGIREGGLSLIEMLPRRQGFQIGAFLGRPASRGEIRLTSSDPSTPPAIDPRYYEDPQDMPAFLRGLRRLRTMMRGESIRHLIKTELQPTADITDEGFEAELRAKGETSFHPTGTARMGNDPRAVVDPSLRVRGIRGLRIADASVIPAPLCAGTHGPVLMIGEKAADLIARYPA